MFGDMEKSEIVDKLTLLYRKNSSELRDKNRWLEVEFEHMIYQLRANSRHTLDMKTRVEAELRKQTRVAIVH